MSGDRELLNVRCTIRGRWFHVAAYWGSAPGSHMGFWRTEVGTFRGWNYRVGRLGRCFTALIHTRPA